MTLLNPLNKKYCASVYTNCVTIHKRRNKKYEKTGHMQENQKKKMYNAKHMFNHFISIYKQMRYNCSKFFGCVFKQGWRYTWHVVYDISH